MNVEELLEKVPENLRPVVAKYGPVLVKMTADELWAWIELIINGKTQEAIDRVMGAADNEELLDVGADLSNRWAAADKANASKLALQKQAALAILQVLLGVALAMVGL